MRRNSTPASDDESATPVTPVLDYSSPAAEDTQTRTPEQIRREAVAAYNEATVGDRHPILGVFLRIAILAALQAAFYICLPRAIARPLGALVLASFFVWQIRTEGWSGTHQSIRNPFRWW